MKKYRVNKQLVKTLIKEQGWSISKFGQSLGHNHFNNALGETASGVFTIDAIRKISDELDIDPDELILTEFTQAQALRKKKKDKPMMFVSRLDEFVPMPPKVPEKGKLYITNRAGMRILAAEKYKSGVVLYLQDYFEMSIINQAIEDLKKLEF